MRLSIPLIIITAWAAGPLAGAQAAASRPAEAQQTAAQPAPAQPAAAQPAATAARKAQPPRSRTRLSRPRHGSDGAPATVPGAKRDGVLTLGETDITGNKELPKVMAIVPWKDSLGPGRVMKPTDSLMDEIIAPVDRGAFQRRIRYYGQLNPQHTVPPVGDSH